jgi:hypothetical protein
MIMRKKESERVTSYEEALMVLQKDESTYLKDMPKNAQAYYKLCTISEALNIGHTREERIYFPWWNNIKDLNACTEARFSYDLIFMNSSIRFWLGSFDKKTALYLGSEKFIELWKEYLV